MFGGGSNQDPGTAINPVDGLPIAVTTTGTDTGFLSALGITAGKVAADTLPWYVWAILGGAAFLIVRKLVA